MIKEQVAHSSGGCIKCQNEEVGDNQRGRLTICDMRHAMWQSAERKIRRRRLHTSAYSQHNKWRVRPHYGRIHPALRRKLADEVNWMQPRVLGMRDHDGTAEIFAAASGLLVRCTPTSDTVRLSTYGLPFALAPAARRRASSLLTSLSFPSVYT